MRRYLEGWLRRMPRAAWAGGYLLVVSSGLAWLFGGWAYDDPFITYRYAANLSEGLGMVYNPGERVLSTTTPLFTLLLALLRPLWPDLHGVAMWVGALSLGVGGLCLWDLADREGLKVGRWVGLLFYPGFPLVASTLSSETPLYLALCLGAFAAYRRRHYRLCALAAALAALTRPDAVLVAAVLGVAYLRSHWLEGATWRERLGRLPWQAGLLYLGVGLAWVGFAWAYYGSPIPVTLYAKQQQAAVEGSSAFLPGTLVILSWYTSWVTLAEAALALPGLAYGLVRVPAMRMVAAWSGLYFAAYSLLWVTRYFWYYAPLVPLFILSLGAGLEGVGALLQRWRGGQAMGAGRAGGEMEPAPARAALGVKPVVWLLLGLLLAAQLNRLWKMHLLPDTRFPIYQASGLWLNRHTSVDATVGTLEVGIIGYYAERRIVDFAGLIQPEVASVIGQSGSYTAAAEWATRHYQPDYLLLPEDLYAEVAREAAPGCRHEVTFPGEAYGYMFDLGIYACP